MTTSTDIPAEAILLTHKQVSTLAQLSERTIRMMVSAGRFPRPIRIGPSDRSHKRYVRAEIEAWLRARKENR